MTLPESVMAFDTTITYSVSGNGVSALSDSVTVTTDAVTQEDVTVPASSTDFNVVIAIDVSAMGFLYVSADATMTLETNSGASPDNTLTVGANDPVVWTSSSGLTNPLTVDVTSIKVTSTAGGTLKIRVGQDATP